MLSNQILSIPFLNIFFSLFLLFSLFSVSYNFSKKIIILDNSYLNFIIFYFLFIVSLTLIIFLFALLKLNFEYLRSILTIFFLLNIFSFIYKKAKINFKIEKKYLFLLSIPFILTFIPPMDSDSLDYHLGGAKFILNQQAFEKPLDFFWLHFRLVNFGEMLNVLGLLFNSEIFGQLIQFSGAIIIIYLLSILGRKVHNFNEILIIISTPVLLSLLTSSKPSLIISSIYFFCTFVVLKFYKKKIPNKIIILLSILLSYCVAVKISYLFLIVPLLLILFLKLLKERKYNKILLLIFFLFPLNFLVIFKNIFVFGEPLTPFLHFKESFYSNYLTEWNNHLIAGDYSTKQKNFFYNLINIGMPLKSYTNFSQVLGLSFFCFILFFNKKILKKILSKQNEKIILILAILSFVFFYFSGKGLPRFYFEIYLLILILLKLNYNLINHQIKKAINIIICAQMFVITIAMLMSIYFYLPAYFSKQKYNDIMSKSADGYKLSVWINEKNKSKRPVLIDNFRSRYFINNQFVSTYKNAIDEEFIKEFNIKSIFLRKEINLYDNVNLECFEFKEKLEYSKGSKNFLKKNINETIYYYKFICK